MSPGRIKPLSTSSIDCYIEGLPDWQRQHLNRFREAVHKAAAGAQEGWKWDVPVFSINGRLVCAMSGFAKHTKYNFFDDASLIDSDHLFTQRPGFEAAAVHQSG